MKNWTPTRIGLAALLIICLSILLDGRIATAADTVGKSKAIDLRAAQSRVFSQHGEDGVLERIFEIIEPGPKFCVEFGAFDGIHNSNMRNLILNYGWSSFQIEGNSIRAKKLAENYAEYPNVKTTQAWVWPGNIEILFEDHDVPKDLDLLVIDIDSNDYYVWRAIHDYRPKIVMIEVNAYFPPPQLMVIDYHPMNYWDRTYYHGASLQSTVNLAKKKGYELLYVMDGGPNVIFVAEEYFDLFGIKDNSATTMYRKLSDELMARPIVKMGRDGIPWPKGKSTLTWDKLVIEKKFILDKR